MDGRWRAMTARLSDARAASSRAFAALEQESRTAQAARGDRPDLKLIGTVALAGVMTAVVNTWGGQSRVHLLKKPLAALGVDVKALFAATFDAPVWGDLWRMAWWSLFCFACFFVVPVLYVRLVTSRERLVDYGLGVRGALVHWRVYVVLLMLVLPLVARASSQTSFMIYYPLYKGAGRSLVDFVVWELLYLLQFVAVEFFFRGFLVHAFRARFGAYAVLVPVVPYCMLHFGKPLPEVMGAVVAALFLGGLSLATRTIWLGVAVHMTVAIVMDVLALGERGDLPLAF